MSSQSYQDIDELFLNHSGTCCTTCSFYNVLRILLINCTRIMYYVIVYYTNKVTNRVYKKK